jgi:hypothetical protein
MEAIPKIHCFPLLVTYTSHSSVPLQPLAVYTIESNQQSPLPTTAKELKKERKKGRK